MSEPEPARARVVVRAPNWLGDAVMALPAMGAIRAAFPRATLAVAALPAVAPIFDEGTPARQDELLVVTRQDERERLEGGRFDTIVLLPNSFRSAWVARQAGIDERWGYSAGARRLLLTRAIRRPSGKLHQSAYYLSLVRGLGYAASDDLPRITVTPATRQRADALLGKHGIMAGEPIVGFAPGAAYGHAKRWPPDRVAGVLARVSREAGAAGVLVGAAGDRGAGREIESTLPRDARVVNLIGRTDLGQLAGVLTRCRAFVSNDSGAMHLAAAIGVPVAAIFGPTDDRVTAPAGDHDVLVHQVFCRPCMLRDCPIDHRCMKGISVDEVFGAVSKRLGAAARGTP